MMARGGGSAAAESAGELQLTPPPARQQPRRGAQLHPEALLPRSPTSPELPQSLRSPRTVAATGRRRVQLTEGLEHTTTAGLHAGAALHDPAAASLVAERTGMWGAAATGALPAGSSHLQQLARRQHHQDPKQQLHEEGGDAAAAATTTSGNTWVAAFSPPLRHGSDGGGGGIRSPASRKQTEEIRQQQAVRAFGSFEDTAD
ncbi:hypothetical protein Vafri_5949 [Volvox africanus]|nr:hypothetical protein Vafri_5949 [Volvox africanus]